VTKIRRAKHQKLLDFLQGVPGSATVILTATTPVAGWSSMRLQKLELEAALGMLKEKARSEGCEYILSAPDDKLRQLCELCDGSPVALSMVINVFLGENPDIDLVLENIAMGKDVFRVLCAIAYDELSEQAKRAFRLLCLSCESYAVQALQEILGTGKEPLKETLGELVDAGLVFNTPEMDFEQRRFYPAYRLIREYYQKVVSHANRKADLELKQQTAAYYLSQCQANGGENWAGYDWLEREIREIFQIIEILYQQKDWSNYFAMLEAIYYFLGIRGYWRQKRDLGLQAAQVGRATGDEKHAALALVRVAGWTEIQLKMFAEAEEHLRQGLELYEKLGDPGGRASALRYLGSICRRRDDLTGAHALYRAALQACEEAPSPSRERLRAGIQVSLSMLYCKEGNLVESRKQLESALGVFQSIGHLSKMAEVLSRLGDLDLMEGKTAAAEAHFTQSEALVQQTGRSKTRAYNLLGLARLKALQGDGAGAAQLAEQARQLFRKLEIADETGEITALLKLIP
jgi:tetratricopeptide (TPR) repeat protein